VVGFHGVEVNETGNNTSANRRFVIRVYPNPVNNPLAVSYELAQSSPVECRIYDVTGRVVRTLFRGGQDLGSQSLIWDRKDDARQPVKAGVYFVKLKTAQGDAQAKIVVLN
jgi:flagellar hook assembly protein FlgD